MPLVAMAIGLGLTFALAREAHLRRLDADSRLFDDFCLSATRELEQRADIFEIALHGLGAFLGSSVEVTCDELDAFGSSLGLANRAPGARSLFTVFVAEDAAAGAAASRQRMEAFGAPKGAWPAPRTREAAPGPVWIVEREFVLSGGASRIGVDLARSIPQLAGMLPATGSDGYRALFLPAGTAKAAEQGSLLLFLPVPGHSDTNGRTFAALEVSLEALVRGILGSERAGLDLDVLLERPGELLPVFDPDGHLAGEARAGAAGRGREFVRRHALRVGDLEFLVQFSTMPDFRSGSWFVTFAISFAGFVSSLLLFLVLRQHARQLRSAEKLVDRRTRDLRSALDEKENVRVFLANALHHLDVYRRAIDLHSIVAVTDVRGKITEVNSLFCEISGYSREELIGQDHRIVNSGVHPRSFWKEMWQTLHRGEVWQAEVCNRRKDGSLYWVGTSISPILDLQQQVTGYCAVRTDITAIKESQIALEEARIAADAANESKSQFLANMSHEVRTPLTAILGFLEVLEDRAEESHRDEEEREATRTIRAACDHLMAILNDILDLSKIEAGALDVELAEVALDELLADVWRLMAYRAEGKEIELRFEILGEIPSRVLCDPTRLRQILMNLVGNSVKFTSSGWIEVRIGTRTEDGRDHLIVEVEDTGPGIPEELVHDLFRPFTQADGSVTRQHGGTGLGLTISRRLAELMGGRLELQRTEPGEGSTFVCEVAFERRPDARPCRKLTRHARRGTHSQAPTGLLGRVLVAEDGADNRRLISHHLRRAGLEVELAEDGIVALECLDRAKREGRAYDLLVTDMQMPRLDGYSLVRRLRAEGVELPILALTAHAMSSDRDRCLEAGCDAYSSKPLKRVPFLQLCADLLGQGVAVPD